MFRQLNVCLHSYVALAMDESARARPCVCVCVCVFSFIFFTDSALDLPPPLLSLGTPWAVLCGATARTFFSPLLFINFWANEKTGRYSFWYIRRSYATVFQYWLSICNGIAQRTAHTVNSLHLHLVLCLAVCSPFCIHILTHSHTHTHTCSSPILSAHAIFGKQCRTTTTTESNKKLRAYNQENEIGKIMDFNNVICNI